jgi:hypothetical protein
MIPDHADDPLPRALQTLPSVSPGADREARVRAKCHARLARHARREATREASVSTVVIQSLLGGLCALYFAAILHDALRLRGFF